MILQIDNLSARVAGSTQDILRGVSLNIGAGEVHAIMGPNGSGKSTLSSVLAGRESYEVTGGSVTYLGQDLLSLAAEERAVRGVFLAFQYPVEIPGVSNMHFLKSAYNAKRKHLGLPEIDAVELIDLVKRRARELGMDEKFLQRGVNQGFSGGEKKRNDILQMSLLEPTLAILDETDSGLDIDALKAVSDGVNRLRRGDRAMIVVTHYQRLLDYIQPDFVHVLAKGKLVKSGDKSLALELEKRGYNWVTEAVA